jgi:uncharacterized protein DUF3300
MSCRMNHLQSSARSDAPARTLLCKADVRSMFVAVLAFVVACGTTPNRVGAAPQSGQPPGNIDELLAPIALYPDQLLAQILLSAGDPATVTAFDMWLKANEQMKGTQLQNAALKKGFEPSFVALALFPQVISRMAEQIEWTTLVGQAFAADRNVVFASIQRLRHQAQDVGTLKDTPQQEISTRTTSGGDNVIVIEPANPQVVYVPQYNSTTVYTQAPTTVVVQQQSSSDAVAAGLIGFTAGIAIGAAVNNNYYYGPYGWHGGGYMYNDAWDDYYDAREDAREDWQDHREDLVEERGDRAQNASEQRTERRSTSQEQRTDRQQTRTENRPQTQSATQQSGRTGSAEAQAVQQRSGGSTDAFSGYSNGGSERSSSARGQRSRSSSAGRSGGGRRR